MSEISTLLQERIAEDGPLTVAEYMGIALTHHRGGYYMTRDPFGTAGDFITAPEISQMFGELIGLWCAVAWQSMGMPETVNLVELGPGRGTLMADALRAARAVPAFQKAVRPHLVEISPTLTAVQKETLGRLDLPHAPTWSETFAEVPEGPMILFANEFFDALPIRQFERTDEGWFERLVTVDPAGGFCFTLAREETARLGPAPEGSIQEMSPESLNLVKTIGERLAAQGGAALIIDYGHGESGYGDTLQAVRGQEYADVLGQPGDVDLTAHVDFEALADAAEMGGGRCFGPIAQGHFLMALGIEMRAQALLDKANEAQRREIMTAHHRLVHPDEMGLLFKALAVVAPGMACPPGFEAS
ncbi:SAM-dependent methyltransferase [Magnetospira thiophila]